jgi:hypothetical protein
MHDTKSAKYLLVFAMTAPASKEHQMTARYLVSVVYHGAASYQA